MGFSGSRNDFGAAAGVVVGLLYPLRRNRYGGMVVTALAAIPFYAAIGYSN